MHACMHACIQIYPDTKPKAPQILKPFSPKNPKLSSSPQAVNQVHICDKRQLNAQSPPVECWWDL